MFSKCISNTSSSLLTSLPSSSTSYNMFVYGFGCDVIYCVMNGMGVKHKFPHNEEEVWPQLFYSRLHFVSSVWYISLFELDYVFVFTVQSGMWKVDTYNLS